LLLLLIFPKTGCVFKSSSNALISFVAKQRALRGFPKKIHLCCCCSRFVLIKVCPSFTTFIRVDTANVFYKYFRSLVCFQTFERFRVCMVFQKELIV
jgi:hypothetical protein